MSDFTGKNKIREVKVKTLADGTKIIDNPFGRVFGYIRVSTANQKTDRQLDTLLEYGVPEYAIFVDKYTGKSFNRPAYKKLLRIIRKGDIIVIKELDRLGRNYQEIIDQWRMLTVDIGCGIHIIDMPILNTSGDPEDLLSKFVTDMMLQVLSFVAENENQTRAKRQREGIDAAKRRRKVTIGRPKKPMPFDFWEIFIMWKTREFGTNDLWRYCHEVYGMSNRTFYRRINELNQRFGDLPPQRLYDLILDEEYFEGFHFDNERLEAGVEYYNHYVLNNPDKERDLRERKRKAKEENPSLTKEEEEIMKREILAHRQKNFRERFNIPEPELMESTEMPTELIRKKPKNPGAFSEQVNKHKKNSGMDQAIVLIDNKPIIPDIRTSIDPQKPMTTIVVI